MTRVKKFGVSIEEPPITSIGDRLELALIDAKVARGAFCMEMGIARPTLWNYIRGEREMPVGLIKKILVRFDLDAEWFLFGDQGRDQAVSKADENSPETE